MPTRQQIIEDVEDLNKTKKVKSPAAKYALISVLFPLVIFIAAVIEKMNSVEDNSLGKGYIISFIIATLVGLVCSIIGLTKIKENGFDSNSIFCLLGLLINGSFWAVVLLKVIA